MIKGQFEVTKDKKRKTAESSPLTMHNRACAVGRTQQAATSSPREFVVHCVAARGWRATPVGKSAHAV